MKTKKRKGLGSESGQVLPITVLFMGVIIGAAAISIDVAKVSALRNQAQTATSAAALAAAQQIASQINDVVQANGTTSSSTVPIVTMGPTAAAQEIYKSNIATAIGHSSNLNNCQVSYYVGSTLQPSASFTLSSLTVPVYVRVTAEGSTPMNFGAALGISSASVKPEATAEVVPQSKISTSSMLPLLLPATAGSETNLPDNKVNTWSTYWTIGKKYAVYRANASGKVPSWIPNGINYPYLIPYLTGGGSGGTGSTKFGNGVFGWISNLNSTLTIGEPVSVNPGTHGWSTELANVVARQLYVIPIANPMTIDGQNSTSNILGYATITIDEVNNEVSNGGESGLGFVFTLDSDTALPGDTLSASTPQNPVNYSVQLVSNSSVP